MQELPIAIVGAGTAGLASALFLRRQGFNVRVLERVPNLQAVGAGVLLQPSGMAVLQQLGLFDQCSRFGAPVSRLYGTSSKGRTILDTRYAHWQPDSFGMGMHRSVLLAVLRNALQEAGVQVETAVDVSRFAQHNHCVQLFSPDSQGVEQHLGDFSALILADGVRSVLRQQMQVKQTFRPYPWGALWSLVATPSGAETTDLRQWYRGCSRMFGVMPTGSAHHEPARVLSSLFWSIPVSQIGSWRDAGLGAWKAEVLKLAGNAAEPYLQQVEQPEQLSQAVYADVRMQQWHDGRVLAIGDCAHAMSPQLGQGANMALVDAAALAGAVAQQRAEALDWPTVFAGYGKVRYTHLRYYRQASCMLTPLFQSHWQSWGWIRDAALLVARHNPLGRHHAVNTLIGGRQGWLWSKDACELHVWDGKKQLESVSAQPVARQAAAVL